MQDEPTGLAGAIARMMARFRKCAGCGLEFLVLGKGGKCWACLHPEETKAKPPEQKKAPETLRDRVRAAREELENQRFQS